MAYDPEGVVTFESNGSDYRLFFGMRALKAVELHYDKPFLRAVEEVMPRLSPEEREDKAKVAEATADMRFTEIATFLGFALLKYHPELDENDVDDLIDDIGMNQASEGLGRALAAALGAGKDAGATADENPPLRQTKPSRTGSRSSKTGSVPA